MSVTTVLLILGHVLHMLLGKIRFFRQPLTYTIPLTLSTKSDPAPHNIISSF